MQNFQNEKKLVLDYWNEVDKFMSPPHSWLTWVSVTDNIKNNISIIIHSYFSNKYHYLILF